jgi:hypothetical protein
MDTLTIAGIIASIIAIGLAFFSMWYSQHMTKQRLRKIARATMALQANQDEQALCKIIKEISPHACPLLDYTIEMKDGDPVIRDWTARGQMPSKEELIQRLEQLRTKMKQAL